MKTMIKSAFLFCLLVANAHAIECVDYIKSNYPAYASMAGSGKAENWWSKAASLPDKFNRTNTPTAGAVLVFPHWSSNSAGHVAYVTKVLSNNEILINHANWNPVTGKVDGGIYTNISVKDASNGKWTAVKMQYGAKNGVYGNTSYAVFGFISPKAAAIPVAKSLNVACSKATLLPGKTVSCNAVVYYNTGTSKEVTTQASWALSAPQYATLSAGIVKAKGATKDQPETVTASYVDNGVSVTGSSSALTIAGVDGKMPASMGCSATSQAARSVAGMTATLFYAPTCNAYWAMVTTQTNNLPASIAIYRPGDSSRYSAIKGVMTPMLYQQPGGAICISLASAGKKYEICNGK